MNKRYIDFVPASQTGKDVVSPGPRARVSAPVKTSAKAPVRSATRVSPRASAKVPSGSSTRASAKVSARTSSGTSVRTSSGVSAKISPKTSVKVQKKSENLNHRFVKTASISKRPLSRRETLSPTRASLARSVAPNSSSATTAAKTGIAAIKAKKIGNKALKTATGKTMVSAKKTGVKSNSSASKITATGLKKSTYEPPKNYFINQAKIEKRPLSKTVYAKKPVAKPAEKTSAPVTIIAKPEKQNHAGAIIAIILTIILGAAAGTVAFLLLPK